MQMKFAIVIILNCMLVNVVFAQINNPFAVTAYGNFSNIMATGNPVLSISLSALQNHHSLYGVGA